MSYKIFIKIFPWVFCALLGCSAAQAQDTYPGASFPSPYNYQPPAPAPEKSKSETAPKPKAKAKAKAKQPTEPPIHIAADHLEQIPEKNLVKAWGNVRIVYEKRTILADKVMMDPNTGKGQAEGHVVMIAENGTKLRATKAQINIKSEKGRMFDAHGTLGSPDGIEYYVKGKDITKVNETRYRIKDASLTTCTGKIPDWLIEFDDAEVVEGDRALFKGGVVKIRNMPIAYVPIGYVPLDNERKTGFLTPSVGSTNLDGFTLGNTFFWAIDDHQDATIGIDYMEKRGVRTSLEYRYTPSQTTSGMFNGVFLDDKVTGNFFWKIDAYHTQELPYGWKLNGKLDLTSKSNFNKTFRNQTENRTRRSSDSWATLFKTWGNQSFDILARLRQSEDDGRDDTFGLLPQAIWRTQPVELGRTGVYFNQDTNFTTLVTDLDGSPAVDKLVNIERVDLHPQLSAPLRLFPWLNFTPTIGVRNTFYSDSFVGTQSRGVINRELIDVQGILEGPKVNKIFHVDTKEGSTKYKHVIEPRFVYNFIPDMDEADRNRIFQIDGIDRIPNTNRVAFFLTQRLLRKVTTGNSSNTEQIARFEISQIYDFNEAERTLVGSNDKNRPFSTLRFDWDSRPFPFLMLNFDSTFNIYTGVVETFNFDVGVKPTDNLMLIMERRLAHNTSASILGTIDYSFLPGWNMKFSVRFDEFNETLLEKNGRLTFNDPCRCWGASLDVVQRLNINGGLRQEETRFLFNLTLRGLGELVGNEGETFIHRSF